MATHSTKAAPIDLPLGRYRHYKGQFYQVIDLVQHSETEEWLVLYRCLYGDHSLWVRPLKMFVESITQPNGDYTKRFTWQPVDHAD